MPVIVFLEGDDGERKTAAYVGQFLKHRFKFFYFQTCILDVNKMQEIIKNQRHRKRKTSWTP